MHTNQFPRHFAAIFTKRTSETKKRFPSLGNANANPRLGGHRAPPALLQPALLHRAPLLPARPQPRHLLRVVRLANRRAELPAHRGLREGLDTLQRRRALHPAGRQAGPAHGPRPGPGCRRVPQVGRHLQVHPRELHERPEHGSGAGHAGHARAADAGE